MLELAVFGGSGFSFGYLFDLKSKAIAHFINDELLNGETNSAISCVIIDPFLIEVPLDDPAVQYIHSDVIFQRFLVVGQLLIVVVPSRLADFVHVRFFAEVYHVYQHQHHAAYIEEEDESDSEPAYQAV